MKALILGGGKSSRMGEDKALKLWKGKPFVQHLIERVSPFVEETYLSGSKQRLSKYGTTIEDEVVDQGPVMAMSSSFKSIESSHILVLSCDVPQISPSAIQSLIDQVKGDLTYYNYGGRDMPLVGIYNKVAQKAVVNHCQTGERRLFSAISGLDVHSIPYKESEGLQNINTQKDFSLL